MVSGILPDHLTGPQAWEGFSPVFPSREPGGLLYPEGMTLEQKIALFVAFLILMGLLPR